MHMTNWHKSSGFTLVEILVALVILGIGIFSVMAMLSSSVKGNAQARKMVRAINIAEREIEEFLADGTCSCDSTQGAYVCESNSTSMSVPHCRITIKWQSYGQDKEVSLQTLRSN